MIPQIAKVQSIEDVIKMAEQVDLPLGHFSIPGVYVRAMMIPKDTVLTGKVHNHECVSIVAKGSITVTDGNTPKRLEAGWIGITPPGLKRAGFAHEDTVFITAHRCDETEIEKIEHFLVSESYEQFLLRADT
ncbi:MAG: hypothetical protein WC505_07965 [Patescibacteria group bacterium]